MKKVRLIISTDSEGSQERVLFTEDFEADQSEFVVPGFSVVFDEVIEADLPAVFPLDYDLTRE